MKKQYIKIFFMFLLLWLPFYAQSQTLRQSAKQQKQELEGEQKSMYEDLCKNCTLDKCFQYLRTYPKGKYVSDVNKRIEDIRLWETAKQSNTIQGYNKYIVLSKYNLFIKEALREQDRLKQIAKQDVRASAAELDAEAEKLFGQAKIQRGHQRTEALLKADSVLNILGTKYPQYSETTYYKRFLIMNILYPKTVNQKAMEISNKLVYIILVKRQRDKISNERLIDVYTYMAYVYSQQEDFKTSKIYWQRILDIDPKNDRAKKAIAIMKKFGY